MLVKNSDSNNDNDHDHDHVDVDDDDDDDDDKIYINLDMVHSDVINFSVIYFFKSLFLLL